MIVSYGELPSIRSKHSGKIVLTGGCFDILHPGHIDGIGFSRQQGDVLVVGVVPDKRVRERKGAARPIQNETDRLKLVAALQGVDYAFIMPTRTAATTSTMRAVRALRPDIFVLYNEGEARFGDDFAEVLAAHGVQLVMDMAPKVNSTSEIIAKILAAGAVE